MRRVPRGQFLLLAAVLSWQTLVNAAEEATVRPEAGEQGIVLAVNAAIKAGGGRIILEPGTYELRRGLALQNAKNIALIGRPGATLKFAPQVCATAAADAPKGQDFVEADSAEGLAEGMRLEIQAQGLLDTTPSGAKYQRPFFDATVVAVEGNRIRMRRPLEYAVPKGTRMVHVYSAIVLGGGTANVTIEGLTIDLNRDQWPVKPLSHSSHCAVLGQGPYDYYKGVTGPPVESVVIRQCVIRNCHHRGIAWYSVIKSSVFGCRIENTGAEGIDFDHFAFHCVARDNDIRNCHVGVELNDASDCLVENNRIEDCEKGIILWRWCRMDDLNLRNVFRGNRIVNTKTTAISCEAATSKSIVSGNTIAGCGAVGIHIAGDDNTVTGNTLSACGKEAVKVTGLRNTVKENEVK